MEKIKKIKAFWVFIIFIILKKLFSQFIDRKVWMGYKRLFLDCKKQNWKVWRIGVGCWRWRRVVGGWNVLGKVSGGVSISKFTHNTNIFVICVPRDSRFTLITCHIHWLRAILNHFSQQDNNSPFTWKNIRAIIKMFYF